jgi:hypothetical protein
MSLDGSTDYNPINKKKRKKYIQTSVLFVGRMLSSLLKEHQAKQAAKKETRGKIKKC